MAVVYHWKHGWIPLDHTAALAKAKGNRNLAEKMLHDAPSAQGITSRQHVAKATLDLPNLSGKHRDEAIAQLRQAAQKHDAHDLLPNASANYEPNKVGWHPMTDGSRWRETPTGVVVERGAREVHILGTSVEAQRKARRLIAEHSFDRLFKAGKRSPHTKNSAFIRL